MKEKINSYFAVLIITIAGASATLLIVHVANADAAAIVLGQSELQYAPLQHSILTGTPEAPRKK